MPSTARALARTQITTDIVDAARRQLAEAGAQQLSLRAVAREVGVVSSAVYRYFPSRDDLLTRLIVDAYDGLADAITEAEAEPPRSDLRGRWRAASHGLRGWARARPHEYALAYGSPVPGYAAPETTIAPAARVPAVHFSILQEAAAAGALDAPGLSPSGRRGLDPQLRGQLETLVAQVAPDIPLDVLARALAAWTQLFGAISFELFGHLVGVMEPADAFFAHSVDLLADQVGLPPARGKGP